MKRDASGRRRFFEILWFFNSLLALMGWARPVV
jgi:hypothetical protein